MVHNTTKPPKKSKVNSDHEIDRDCYRRDRYFIQVSWLFSYVKVLKIFCYNSFLQKKVYFVCRLEQQADDKCRLQLYTLDVYFH
jgi:hypothetical protein